MKLTFDYYYNLEQVDLFLCNPDGRELFPLPGKSRNLTLRFNDLSELTFEVDSKITLSNNTVVDLEAYDYIQTKRLVYATNIGWFQISGVDEHDNGVVKYKTVKAESYQSVLKNKGFISEERVYCFYNPNDPHDDRYDSTKEDSIPSVLGQWSKQLGVKQALGQGLSEPTTPYDDWTVTYIHSSLIYAGAGSKCRTFKESVTYGYDWMVNDVEEAFEVVILFDFMYKTIHVMTPNEVAQRVNVIYTFNNFMKSVDINEASEDIVTVLNCNGDNCDITAVNPTGTNYICDFSYYMDKTNYRWMSSALIEKLEQWKKDCDDEKDTYEGYVENIRALYQSATEKETLLQEMSLSLADLRTAQNKRTVLGSGKPGSLCGIVTAESVKSYRTTKNGVETVVGGRSIMSGTDYYSTDFTGAKTITAYQFSPKYNEETRRWDWSQAGATKRGTADEIVAFNLSDDNTSGVSYWYFSDVSDNSSYCKLQSAVTVNKDSATSTNYCGGFDRYIAYTYPSYVGTLPRKADLSADDTTTLTLEDLLNDVHNTSMSWSDIKAKYSIADDAGGTTVYTDKVSVWINLRESRVDALNIELYGYALKLNGYQMDKAGEVINPTSTSIYGRINTLQSQISSISSRLNILSYFADTPTLLRELNCYWIEGDYTNENIAVLEETTPEEEIYLANELFDAGCIELSKVCQPRFSFSIESRNATKQYEFKDQMRLLELGKIVTIEKEEGLWYYPALLEISMNLDNGDEFSMTFANAMRLDDWGYTYADLISDASSTSRKVSANWQDILAYSKERAEISSLIKDPLDTTLRASFANMVNQEFTVDKNGILGRKKVSEISDEFEDEQVRLINNLLIFTDDNWETAKTALGKIYYTDDDGKQVTSYGLIAETIIGSLIMGERLKIKNANSTVTIGAEGIAITNEDTGEDIFRASSDGTLIVQNYATNTSLSIQKGEILAEVSNGYASKTELSLMSNQIMLRVTDALSGRPTYADLIVQKGEILAEVSNGYASKTELSLMSNQISAKVSSSGGSSSFSWSLTDTGFLLYSNNTQVMQVTSSGLEVTGTINANNGNIGGFFVDARSLYCITGSTYAGIFAPDYDGTNYWTCTKKSLVNEGLYSTVRFFCGAPNYGTVTQSTYDSIFAVLHDGSLYASAASITGSIQTKNSSKYVNEDNMLLTTEGKFESSALTISGYSGASYDTQSGYSIRVIVDANDICWYRKPTGTTSSRMICSIANYATTGNTRMGRSGFDSSSPGAYVQFSNGLSSGAPDARGSLVGTWSASVCLGTVSDENYKNSIEELDEKYSKFFDLLSPKRFRYNDGTSGRYHTGFIAQDVERAIIDSGLDTQQVGLIVKHSESNEATGEISSNYTLRYNEFTALNVREIQKLKARVADLEAIVAKIQEG